jgi:hypothetical protein
MIEIFKTILMVLGFICMLGIITLMVSSIFFWIGGGFSDEMMTEEHYQVDDDDSIAWGDVKP